MCVPSRQVPIPRDAQRPRPESPRQRRESARKAVHVRLCNGQTRASPDGADPTAASRPAACGCAAATAACILPSARNSAPARAAGRCAFNAAADASCRTTDCAATATSTATTSATATTDASCTPSDGASHASHSVQGTRTAACSHRHGLIFAAAAVHDEDSECGAMRRDGTRARKSSVMQAAVRARAAAAARISVGERT